METEAGRRLLRGLPSQGTGLVSLNVEALSEAITAIEAEAAAAEKAPDWCGHAAIVDANNADIRDRDEALAMVRNENARLRKIEEAARALCDEWPWGAQHIAPPTALRAALEAER